METWEMIYFKVGDIVTGWVMCLVQVAVFGALLTSIWYLMKKRWIKNSNAHFVYTSLRATLVSFAVPIIYVGHSLQNYYNDSSDAIGIATKNIINICYILCLIWLCGVLYMLRQYWMESQRFRGICHTHCPADKESKEILHQICEKLHIRRKIELYILPAGDTPFICGVWHPTIYLPMRTYSADEMELILMHECIHYLQRDSLWKKFTICLRCILWFCPLIHELSIQLQTWCEYSCDSKCCRHYQPKAYFGLLYELADRSSMQNCLMASYLTEPETKLNERIKYMKREKNFRKKAGIAVALGTVLFAFGGIGGMVSVDAAMTEAYSALVDATAVEVEVAPDQTMEYETLLTPEEEANMFLGDGEAEDAVMLASSFREFKWNVEANKISYSATISVKKGDLINISASPSPLDSKIQIGIITPDKTKKYIVCTGKGAHAFTVSKGGNYKVFVKNCSKKKITVTGSYSAY